MKRLTGAARNQRHKRVLIDEARDVMTLRHVGAPSEVEALLIAAERKVPTRNPKPLRPEIAEQVTPSPLVVIRETGHGIHHGSYRADVAR